MIENRPPEPILQLDEPASERIEFSPSHINRIAGLIGKLSTHSAGELYQSPPEYKLTALLDHYQEAGNVPELEPLPERSGDIDQDSSFLEHALWASPRLEKPIFLPKPNLEDAVSVCKIIARRGEEVRLPVRNFVYAPGVHDWNRGNTSRKSNQIIRSYARQAEELEPIDLVSAYVQPNGVVFYRLLRDGSHRLSAAHLKDEKSIAVGGTITVKRLPRNIIPLLQTKLH